MERDPRLDAVAASDLSSAAILASLIGMLGAKGILAVRWTRLVRQFGGLAKVDRVGFYAANCSVICAVS
jgi:hypothetical protein